MSQLKFRIHFERPDGTEDSMVITGDTVAEIRQQAEVEVEVRNAKNPWSEELEERG
jgi:hypothetical protein